MLVLWQRGLCWYRGINWQRGLCWYRDGKEVSVGIVVKRLVLVSLGKEVTVGIVAKRLLLVS